MTQALRLVPHASRVYRQISPQGTRYAAGDRRDVPPRQAMRKRHIAVVYNAYVQDVPDPPEDRGSTSDLRLQMRNVARHLRRLGHTVIIVPLADDLFAFQRRLRRIDPDVVFNLYDD